MSNSNRQPPKPLNSEEPFVAPRVGNSISGFNIHEDSELYDDGSWFIFLIVLLVVIVLLVFVYFFFRRANKLPRKLPTL